MDKYAEVCWRNKPDEINDALDAYRSRVLALEAREKELGEGKLEWQRKYHDCLSKNDSYNSEFMELRQENYRLRKVVDAAREMISEKDKNGHDAVSFRQWDALEKAVACVAHKSEKKA